MAMTWHRHYYFPFYPIEQTLLEKRLEFKFQLSPIYLLRFPKTTLETSYSSTSNAKNYPISCNSILSIHTKFWCACFIHFN